MSRPSKAEFLDLHRQVDELFEELIFRPWAISGRMEWRPAMDLHETADAYFVDIDLPGVAPEEVRILVNERNLVVKGQRAATSLENVLLEHCERQCGAFHRSLSLAQPVDPEKARAECRHGTYRIYLPKKVQPAKQTEETALQTEGAHYVIQVTVS